MVGENGWLLAVCSMLEMTKRFDNTQELPNTCAVTKLIKKQLHGEETKCLSGSIYNLMESVANGVVRCIIHELERCVGS